MAVNTITSKCSAEAQLAFKNKIQKNNPKWTKYVSV